MEADGGNEVVHKERPVLRVAKYIYTSTSVCIEDIRNIGQSDSTQHARVRTPSTPNTSHYTRMRSDFFSYAPVASTHARKSLLRARVASYPSAIKILIAISLKKLAGKGEAKC